MLANRYMSIPQIKQLLNRNVKQQSYGYFYYLCTYPANKQCSLKINFSLLDKRCISDHIYFIYLACFCTSNFKFALFKLNTIPNTPS